MKVKLGVAALAFVAWYVGSLGRPPTDSFPVAGTVSGDFANVEAAFRENYASGFEREGSAFAVYLHGRKVVDLWGGYADASQLWTWKEETMSVVFSTTKAVCALAMAALVDRGHLDYEAPVTKYWPRFGNHGKANVTVRMLLSHKAGLAFLDGKVTEAMIRDEKWEEIGRLMEEQPPNWAPGHGFGYHALTYGLITEQLVRRSDPKRRSLGTFLREEITGPHKVDVHLGLPRSEYHRVARHTMPGIRELLAKLTNWASLKIQLRLLTLPKDSLMGKAFYNPDFLGTSAGGLRTNHADTLALEFGSANGVATARGLAQLFSLLLQGKIVKRKEVMDILREPFYRNERDLVLDLVSNVGHGFGYSQAPDGAWEFGHPGYGGQNVKVNLGAGLSYAYVTNGLTPDMGDGARCFSRLRAALYHDLSQLPPSS